MAKNGAALQNVENLAESIKDTENTYAGYRDKNWHKNEELHELMSLLFDLYWSQIHEYLVPRNNLDCEKEIKRHIKVANRLMTDVKKKIAELETSSDDKLLHKYLKLYEDLYALVAFRSLEHYAVFMEWDVPEDKKVWKNSMPIIGGIFHYSGKAILDNERKIKFISKQMPTGTGKSYSDAYIISWILGLDINHEVIKIVGNPALVLRNTSAIASLIAKERFAKVFPYFRQFHEKGNSNVMNEIFSTAKLGDGQLTIVGSSKPVNVEISAKDTYVDGIRGQFLFLDDITRSKDKDNIREHDKDIARFDDSWFKRKYDENNFIVFIGGTTYSIYDILTVLIGRHSNDVFYQSDYNKYTHLNADGSAVFVRIPKLDYDTDECLFPHIYSKKEAVKERNRDLRTFMAMEQQMPLPPEDTPFFWTNLNTYTTVPQDDRPDYCYAALDPARKGKNYVALGIHTPINGKHFLIDALYQKRPMEELHDEIIEKIIKHNIVKLYIENNTDTSLKKLLIDKLAARGVSFCEITDGFSYLKKEDRIHSKEATIKNNVFYPDRELYARSSQIGKYMEHIVSFSYEKNNSFDDSIDCEALYADKFIKDGSSQTTKSKLLYLNKRRTAYS